MSADRSVAIKAPLKADETAKRRLREAIERYVLAHPGVADTAGGIVQWWLPSSGFEGAIDLIDEVLAGMVDEGFLRRRRLPDGGVLYAAAGSVGFEHDDFTENGG